MIYDFLLKPSYDFQLVCVVRSLGDRKTGKAYQKYINNTFVKEYFYRLPKYSLLMVLPHKLHFCTVIF